LRTGDPPVLGRVERSRLLLDLRCLPSTVDDELCAAILACT
jgi:L-seryl-tRNA(Ser) seleniumtransferase